MSNEAIESVKAMLVAQLGKIDDEMGKVVAEAHPEAPRETAELAAFSWQLQIQETRTALHNRLASSKNMLVDALKRVASGIYGICEHCGNQIEEARLKIMPTTTLCVGCK